MSTDDLTQAARRAGDGDDRAVLQAAVEHAPKALPPALADYLVRDFTQTLQWMDFYAESDSLPVIVRWPVRRARAVLSLPVSTPDRDTLVHVLNRGIDDMRRSDEPAAPYVDDFVIDGDREPLVRHLTDVLLSAGLVRTPTVTPEDFGRAANLLIYNLTGREAATDSQRAAVRSFLGTLGLSVVEGDA